MRTIPSYVLISAIFFICVCVVLLYSFVFYPFSHPINCFIESQTGQACSGCGLSRSISALIHLDFEKGRLYNAQGPMIFVFLLVQLFIRGGVTGFYFTTHKSVSPIVPKLDTWISISLFLLAFLPVLKNLN